MTTNESKLVKQALRPFADSGLISAATMAELTEMKQADGKPARPDLVNREQGTEMLNVCAQTLINWEKKGILKPIKLAGKRLVRYHMSDIENLITVKV
ncbi:MAG: helix-turn-helix domain-containing protein [Lentisphaerota bacterium]